MEVEIAVLKLKMNRMEASSNKEIETKPDESFFCVNKKMYYITKNIVQKLSKQSESSDLKWDRQKVYSSAETDGHKPRRVVQPEKPDSKTKSLCRY